MASPIYDYNSTGYAAPVQSRATKTEVIPGSSAAGQESAPAASQSSSGDSVEVSEAYQRFYKMYCAYLEDPVANPLGRPDSKYICDGMDQPGRFVEGEDGYFRWLTTKDEYNQGGLQGLLDNWDREERKNPRRVETIKAAVEFLVPEKKNISEIINRLGKEAGISKSDISKLKIELDSKGKIVVGGIKNTKKLKAMEKALNREEGLASRIDNYQTAEMVLLQETTFRGSDAKTLAFRDYNSYDENSVQGFGYIYYSQIENECKELDDVDELSGLMAPEDYALAELYRDKTPTADFSFGQKGVANPEAALKKWSGRFAGDLRKEVHLINRRNDAEDDPLRQVNLDNVTYKITSDGGVEIVGRLSDDDIIDTETRTILEGLIRDAILDTGEEGRESLFETAAASMLRAHDEAFGDGRAGKSAVLEFDSSGRNIKTYIDAPGAKEEVSHDMAVAATAYVNGALNDRAVTADDFSVDDKGVLTYTGGNARAADLFKELQNDIAAIRSGEDESGGKSAQENRAALELVGLMDEFNSYGPDADNGYLNGSTIDEEAFRIADRVQDCRSRYDYKYAGPAALERGGTPFTWGNYSHRPYYTEAEKKNLMGQL